MCELSWNIFIMTGNVNAYLLYKQASHYEEQQEFVDYPFISIMEQSAIHNEVIPYYIGGQECYMG